MTFQEIGMLLVEKFGDELQIRQENTLQAHLYLNRPKKLVEVCQFLHQQPNLFFDQLACISVVDTEKNTFEIIYQLYSYPHECSLTLALSIEKENPVVCSISSIWKAAEWHEREAYDLFGVVFENHPDLRRILLPADWKGFPLRKDYKTAASYHNIKVDY